MTWRERRGPIATRGAAHGGCARAPCSPRPGWDVPPDCPHSSRPMWRCSVHRTVTRGGFRSGWWCPVPAPAPGWFRCWRGCASPIRPSTRTSFRSPCSTPPSTAPNSGWRPPSRRRSTVWPGCWPLGRSCWARHCAPRPARRPGSASVRPRPPPAPSSARAARAPKRSRVPGAAARTSPRPVPYRRSWMPPWHRRCPHRR